MEDPRKNAAPRDAHDGYPLTSRESKAMFLGVLFIISATLISAIIGICILVVLGAK